MQQEDEANESAEKSKRDAAENEAAKQKRAENVILIFVFTFPRST